MREQIFAPLDLYQNELKAKHEKNVGEYLDTLVQKSGIDGEKNAKTVSAYEKHTADIKTYQSQIEKQKSKRAWLIFLIIGAFFAGVIVLCKYLPLQKLRITLIVVLLAVAVFLICYTCKKLNATIRATNENLQDLKDKADALLDEAYGQTAGLNALFSDYDATDLVSKTLPCLRFDSYFTRARLYEMVNAYDYLIRASEQECVLNVLSGELYGNPFLFEQYLNHYTSFRTYHGSLTIHWTEEKQDSNGRWVQHSRSQTLHASITKPEPCYDIHTCLHYGHDDAPKLCFSRQGKHAEDKTEGQLKRTLRKGEKNLQRLTAQALKRDENFTELLNTEFEILFDATNRNDEIAFRYLFTPNAQEEMLKLLLNSECYGDDFDFIKYKKCNTVRSEHTQFNGIDTSAKRYYSYSLSEIKERFTRLNCKFFESVYFDFAPILTISAYQQPRISDTKIQKEDLCCYNYEILANKLQEYLMPYGAISQAIFKTELLEKNDEQEKIAVTAYTYTAHERVHYERVYGDDENWHEVPVYWTEYIPARKRSVMLVVYTEESRKSMQNPYVTHQGVYACVL
ncbi:MAG: DUF948 domain-containing protein [Clostridiales bacterium]|nr:DUF948 domain-containing protein [Clostridiales bacterium]